MGKFFDALRMKQMATPPTPAAGESLLYPGTDGRWYTKGTDGFEAPAIGRSEDTGWIDITSFLNGWAAWNTDGRTPQYRRKDGVVYLRGLIKSGTVGLAAFNLPAGFRPEDRGSVSYHLPVLANALGAVFIWGNGDVVPNNVTGSATNNSWVDLGSISFPVSQPTSFVIGDDTGWIPMAFQNGFANLDASNWDTGAYRRINGVVYLKGMITNGTRTGNPTIFNLPAGFRPGGAISTHTSFPAYGAPTADFSPSRFNIRGAGLSGAGNVNVNYVAATSWLSFTGISFPADDAPPVAFVSAGDVVLKYETLNGIDIARNLVAYRSSSPDSTRYMRINTTMRADAGLMPRIHIVGKTGAYDGAFDGHLTIYLYNLSGGTLYSPKWRVFGQAPSSVWVAKDANNMFVILIDNASGWSYAEVLVKEVANTYGTMTKAQTEGWTVTYVGSTADLSAVAQAT